jgi:hypothetical protein
MERQGARCALHDEARPIQRCVRHPRTALASEPAKALWNQAPPHDRQLYGVGVPRAIQQLESRPRSGGERAVPRAPGCSNDPRRGHLPNPARSGSIRLPGVAPQSVYASVPTGHKEARPMTTTNGQNATDDQTTKPAPKAKKSKKSKPTWTLTECALAYLESLKAARKSESTINAYAADLDLATEVLGGETPIAQLTIADIERFNASQQVTTTKSGRAKAQPTIDRSRRVLRLALTFAEQQGAIDAAPLPEKPARAKKDVPLSQREAIGNDDAKLYPAAAEDDPAQIVYASTGEPVSE